MSSPRPFAGRLFPWLVAGAVLSFFVAFLVAAFGEEWIGVRSFGADSFSASALGHRALHALLEREGIEVRQQRRPGPVGLPSAEGTVLLLLEPGFPFDAETLDGRIAAARASGAEVVLALPKWNGWPTTRADWVGAVGAYGQTSIDEMLQQVFPEATEPPLQLAPRQGPTVVCEGPGDARFEVEIDPLHLLRPREGLTPIVRCEDRVLVGRFEPAGVTLIADPELFHNAGLARARHADLIGAVFSGPLAMRLALFDESIHGHDRSGGLVAMLFEFPLVLLVGHGALVLGLAVWAGAFRFGTPPPRPPRILDGKRVLIDNASQLLSFGGHSRESLVEYFEQTLRAVGAHYFFAPDMPTEELRGRLQAVSRTRGLELDLERLHDRIERAASGRGRGSERAVRLAETLHRWRQEMIDGPRTDQRAVDRTA